MPPLIILQTLNYLRFINFPLLSMSPHSFTSNVLVWIVEGTKVM